MKILHIEDNEGVSEPIGIFLESSGHEYETITDGRKGLQLIRENHYDIVLLDMAMPGFSGIEVISALEKDGSIRNEKIVILTASRMSEEQMSELREMGVHSSIGKPVIHAELLKKLQLIEQNHTVTTNVN
ncbi:response regulator transcription factor [Nitrosarchaeum koreense]|nr:response regulator transcription factor [Nitrosarchaeum koreense]